VRFAARLSVSTFSSAFLLFRGLDLAPGIVLRFLCLDRVFALWSRWGCVHGVVNNSPPPSTLCSLLGLGLRGWCMCSTAIVVDLLVVGCFVWFSARWNDYLSAQCVPTASSVSCMPGFPSDVWGRGSGRAGGVRQVYLSSQAWVRGLVMCSRGASYLGGMFPA